MTIPSPRPQKTIVVIGHGMVGLRFCEVLINADRARQYKIVTFCEEPRAAYDRMGLTSFIAHRDAEKLLAARKEWYTEQGVELHLGDRAHYIDRESQVVKSVRRCEVAYDQLVLATGSYPNVPAVPGVEKQGVFIYRSVEDLERMLAYAREVQTCVVIGGGRLGLEAAKVAYDLGLQIHVVECQSRLIPRQLDDIGSRIVVQKLESRGVRVHLDQQVREIHGNGKVEEIEFCDGTRLAAGMVVLSAGIRPRDELARQCGLEMGPNGGIAVNDVLQSNDPQIFAIGECAAHSGMSYGMDAPGYEMAEALASVLTGGNQRFRSADLSVKLNVMGVEIASFGQVDVPADSGAAYAHENLIQRTYKKLVFSPDGKTLLGGILVGDTSEYEVLTKFCQGGGVLPCEPLDLVREESGSVILGRVLERHLDETSTGNRDRVSRRAV